MMPRPSFATSPSAERMKPDRECPQHVQRKRVDRPRSGDLDQSFDAMDPKVAGPQRCRLMPL